MRKILIIFAVFLLASSTIASTNCSYKKVSDVIRTFKKFKHDKKINHFFTKTIIKNGKRENVDCILMVTILKVESDFTLKRNTITPEDISIAQINYPEQKENLKRINIKLNKKRLLKSNKYAIKIMSKVLSLLKKDFPNDPLWYARYNSGWYLPKLAYLHRLEYQWKKIGMADYFVNYKEKNRITLHCVKKHGWKKVMNIYTRFKTKKQEFADYKRKFQKRKKLM